MKTIYVYLLSLAVISSGLFLFYNVNKLSSENKQLSIRIKKIELADSIRSIQNNDRDTSKSKHAQSIARAYYKGKLAVYVDGGWYDCVPKPIFAFPFNGKPYDTQTGLSLTPNDSSRVIHTATSRILVRPNDPRFFEGL